MIIFLLILIILILLVPFVRVFIFAAIVGLFGLIAIVVGWPIVAIRSWMQNNVQEGMRGYLVLAVILAIIMVVGLAMIGTDEGFRY